MLKHLHKLVVLCVCCLLGAASSDAQNTTTLKNGLTLSKPSSPPVEETLIEPPPVDESSIEPPAIILAPVDILTPEVVPAPPRIEQPTGITTADGPPPGFEHLVAPEPAGEYSDGAFTISNAPPPGFEELASAQTTLVDVVFGKRIVASVMATFFMGVIEFENPREVIAAIPDALDDVRLLNALTGKLSVNSEQLCHSDYESDCGKLTPDVASVMFDESTFRAHLFIHPDYLQTHYLETSKYLPRSNSQTASVHSFSFSANGDREAGNLVNLAANSLISYRETRLQSFYDIDSDNGATIDTLSLKHDARGWEYEAGAFRSRVRSTTFLPEQNVLGIRVGTSLNTRTDLDNAEATPLFIYLEQRSRVDLLRGEQLLDSRFYPAGNQQLDTSRLPDGAYNLTVRVAGDGGGQRSEEFYFARTSALPPMNEPLYYTELGQLAESRQSVLPSAVDGSWLRLGTARRVKDDFGLEGSVNIAGDATLIEAGALWLQPGLQVQGSLMAGDASGLSLRSIYARNNMTFSADIRHINSSNPLTVDDLELLSGAFTQTNLSAAIPLFEGRLLARLRLDKRDSGNFRSFGVNYLRELRRYSRSTLNLNIDSSFSSDENIIRLGVDWRWRHKRRDASVKPRLVYASNNTNSSADLLLSARYNQSYKRNETTTIRTSSYVDRDVDQSTLGGRLAAETTRGTADVEVQYGLDGPRSGISYTANARFGAVSSGKEFAFGGRRGNPSSIIVEIGGNAPGALFEVIVDRQSHGYARSGERTLISLPPYASYDVRLVSRGETLVEFDEKPQNVTLYPGNVETLNFTANRQIVVVGQVFDSQGEPVANHRFAELDGFASTDDNGWFQIEITEVKPLTLTKGEESQCVIVLPEPPIEESLVVYDSLSCS